MKSILIFHISEAGGHTKAAENIKEALFFYEPSLEVININAFGYFYPRTERLVNFLYTSTLKYFPFLWGKLYNRKPIAQRLSPLRRRINRLAFKKLRLVLERIKPACVVTTQAFPCGLFADLKREEALNIPLIAVVTDYYPHCFWPHPAVDKYIVASREAKELLLGEGVEEKRIEVLGIPISIRFQDTFERRELCKEFGFLPELKGILLMGGGWGLGPLKKIALALDKMEEEFQIIVICGKNKKLFNWFKRNKTFFKKPLFYFGYTDLVYKIMDFSDIIITKGGGITISEALAKGLGIIVTRPIPGQEEGNTRYLLHQRAIIRLDGIKEIIAWIELIWRNPERLSSLRRRAKEISSSGSSLKIAELILRLLNS